MRRGAWLLLLALGLIAACERPEPTRLQVGTHGVSLVIPPGWEHLDYGEKHLFRKDFENISIEDLGALGRDVDLAAARAIVLLEKDQRREIASRDSFQVSGRQARMIDTWDNLSHQFRKRYVLVMNKRSLLALYMTRGQYGLMDAAFAELKNSLTFTDSLPRPYSRTYPALPDTGGGD